MRNKPTRIGSRGLWSALFLFALAFCGGCASDPNNPDPWEKTNRFIYNLNDGIDRVALKPVADAYVKFIPQPIRGGIGNGFDNLLYFNVVFNDLLQAKWGQGLGDAGRMVANSTVGIGGILDVATGWGLPVHDNDFGITLGKWGCGPGPYLVLPILGPSTLRDSSRYVVEYFATPITYLWLPYKITIPLYAMQTVDLRSRLNDVARFRSEVAIDPYVFTRNAYLQYRDAKIHEGKPATTQSIYDEDTDDETTTAPAK
jgi:phospholipid-binding lipoprotein MlaA